MDKGFKIIIFITFLMMMFPAAKLFSVERQKNSNVIVKYKEFEKFDFEEMVIDGETGGPGDLTMSSRYQRDYSNKLPYRHNFNDKVRRAIETIR